MKALKYLFIAMLPLGFMACGDEDDEADKLEDPTTTVHTQLQKDAQAYFQGEWVATPVKTEFMMGGQVFYTQSVYADTISFGQAYATPKAFYRNDYLKGETYLFTAHGECTYRPQAMGEITECYYSISPEAATFALYTKKDEALYQFYQLSFESASQFTLRNSQYPQVFNKE
ncbi:MAG: hypothetical protein IJB28_09215 [Bacteroidaceae bacterium]|nr:hypothetical protein [Bacteroidaceae bacterium]